MTCLQGLLKFSSCLSPLSQHPLRLSLAHPPLQKCTLLLPLRERSTRGMVFYAMLIYGAWTCHPWQHFPPDIFKCFLVVSVSFFTLVTKSDKKLKSVSGLYFLQQKITLQIKISTNQERKFRTLLLRLTWEKIIRNAEYSVVIPAIWTAQS